MKCTHMFRITMTIALVLCLLAGCQTTAQRGQKQADFHMDQARVYQEQGLLDSALASFGLAIESNPSLIDAHMGMGDIYRQRGNYELSSNSYERAAKLEPKNFEARYYWALSQQLLGHVETSIRIYLEALTLRPDSAEGNEHLASAYLQLNRAPEALPYCKKAAELQPTSQGAWANLGSTYSMLGRYDDSIDAYRRAAGLGKLEEPILLGLANSHLKLEHWDRAIAVLDQLIRMKPSATAHERMGFAQFKLRHFEASLTSFRAALAIDGNDVASLNGMGVALMTQYIQNGRADAGMRDEALASWRKSVQLMPDQPKIVDLISRYQRI